eukprot:2308561-Prymnesium_polylepis.1
MTTAPQHAGFFMRMLLIPADPADSVIWTVMGGVLLMVSSPQQMLGLDWEESNGIYTVAAGP